MRQSASVRITSLPCTNTMSEDFKNEQLQADFQHFIVVFSST